jgi:hypothetical protein
MSIMFSSSSTFHCTWRSARRFPLGKEPFSCTYWWTRVNTRLSAICRREYRCRYSSTAAVVVPLLNPNTKCISASSSSEDCLFTLTSNCTLITARNDCTVCYPTHYRRCSVYMRKPPLAHISYTSAARNSVIVAPETDVCMTHLTQS